MKAADLLNLLDESMSQNAPKPVNSNEYEFNAPQYEDFSTKDYQNELAKLDLFFKTKIVPAISKEDQEQYYRLIQIIEDENSVWFRENVIEEYEPEPLEALIVQSPQFSIDEEMKSPENRNITPSRRLINHVHDATPPFAEIYNESDQSGYSFQSPCSSSMISFTGFDKSHDGEDIETEGDGLSRNLLSPLMSALVKSKKRTVSQMKERSEKKAVKVEKTKFGKNTQKNTEKNDINYDKNDTKRVNERINNLKKNDIRSIHERLYADAKPIELGSPKVSAKELLDKLLHKERKKSGEKKHVLKMRKVDEEEEQEEVTKENIRKDNVVRKEVIRQEFRKEKTISRDVNEKPILKRGKAVFCPAPMKTPKKKFVSYKPIAKSDDLAIHDIQLMLQKHNAKINPRKYG
jgi:hypothetical protein